MNSPELQRKAFLWLLALVTIAFVMVILPFYAAVFWAVILAILFQPLHRRLLKSMPRRPSLAAFATLMVCLVMVILPVVAVMGMLVQEAASIYQRVKSGELDFVVLFQRMVDALPSSIAGLLDRYGVADLAALQAKLGAAAGRASQVIAQQALSAGQNTFEFLVGFGLMLYLLYFLLRDGGAIATQVREAIPLEPAHKSALLTKFITVIRATVKGNIVVAATQGLLGGLILWVLGIEGALLWGVVMAFLSLLPAIGAGLVWGPVAAYFLATGAVWQGLVLIAYGVLVIGLVDNLLRPILVGKDTKLPDYLVLLSTLGGMALVGINGFVIGPVVAALFIATWDLFTSRENR